jgi:hypothetical protein
MRTIIVGIVNSANDLGKLNIVDIETCYRDGSPIFGPGVKLIDELMEHVDKRVIITIEDMSVS